MSSGLPTVGQVVNTGIWSSIMYYLGWFLAIAVFTTVIVLVFMGMSYKFKAIIRVVGKDGAIRKIKKERIASVKVGKARIQKWKFLWSRKQMSPLEFKFINPNNYVFLDQVDENTFVPTPFADLKDYNLTPKYIRYWQALEIKEGAEDYKNQGIWEKYGSFIMTMGTVMFCIILVGVTIYFTYKYHADALQQTDRLVSALRNVVNVPGGMPA